MTSFQRQCIQTDGMWDAIGAFEEVGVLWPQHGSDSQTHPELREELSSRVRWTIQNPPQLLGRMCSVSTCKPGEGRSVR